MERNSSGALRDFARLANFYARLTNFSPFILRLSAAHRILMRFFRLGAARSFEITHVCWPAPSGAADFDRRERSTGVAIESEGLDDEGEDTLVVGAD
jgi:hypothetical protein